MGSERAVWPPHPSPLPTVESSLKAVPIVGERGQNLWAADFSDTHTLHPRALVSATENFLTPSPLL